MRSSLALSRLSSTDHPERVLSAPKVCRCGGGLRVLRVQRKTREALKRQGRRQKPSRSELIALAMRSTGRAGPRASVTLGEWNAGDRAIVLNDFEDPTAEAIRV